MRYTFSTVFAINKSIMVASTTVVARPKTIFSPAELPCEALVLQNKMVFGVVYRSGFAALDARFCISYFDFIENIPGIRINQYCKWILGNTLHTLRASRSREIPAQVKCSPFHLMLEHSRVLLRIFTFIGRLLTTACFPVSTFLFTQIS